MNSDYSEGLAQALFEEAGDALFLFEPQGNQLLDVNPVAERLTGFPRSELLRLPATYLLRFGGQGGMRRLQQACSETMPFHSQDGFYLRTHQDGVWVPVNITVARLHVQPRTLALIVARDVTDRKRVEEALARERNLLRTLMDHLPDHIFVKDAASRFLTANAATVRTLGAEKLEEILGKTDFDFLPRERAEQFHADEQAIVRTGKPLFNGEELLIDAAGQRKWLLTTKVPLRDGAGAVVGLVGMSHDVTERKRAEEERDRLLVGERAARAEAEAAARALRASEEQYRSLAEAIPQIVWTARPDGAIDYCNGRWSEYTGLTLEETREKGWAPVVHADDLPRAPAARWAEALETGKPFEIEYRSRRAADGVYRWHLDRAVPVRDQAGRIVKWFGACTDIDDQKRAAEAMQEAKEAAEAANRAKSEFLANMSHEIRTPMNGIIGMTELALDTRLTREQRDYLQLVRSSADSLLAVINDILDFSRIEARKLHLEAIDFHLRDHLGDMLKTLAQRAEEKGLELAFHVAPDVPDALQGDPGRLRQIIVNLVGNALKFTERGEVVVLVRSEIGPIGPIGPMGAISDPPEARLHFEVSDTGIGIPADKQRLIFEAFSQADASTTRKYGGTGLGLAISSQLVQMMGGRIWVESEAGRGSTFHFTARFGPATGPVVRPAAARPDRLHGLAVLVVDDNTTNRRILEEVLANWGLRPLAVDGGPAALAVLGRAAADGEPFPLVLLDAHMPEMDGFTLAGRIRQAPELAGPALVMLTSAGHPEDVARCRQLGIDAYLMKPVKQSELFNALLTALGQSAPTEAPAGRPASEDHRPPLRVLLAEDSPVNQKLAVRLLEKQGHAVVVAGNGKEALAVLAKQPFDLVLMDVQMPEMDGYEAAGRIRRNEEGSGRHVPILAMTAYAMKGDRERCLAAGMDGYLSKPIQPAELFAAIDRLVPPAEAAPVAVAAPAPPEVLDRAQALHRLGGDADLLKELSALFLEIWPQQQAELHAAVLRRDGPVVKRLAHTLKGSVGNFGAQAVWDAAQRLETMARTGDLSEADSALSALEEALARLRPALAAWAAGEWASERRQSTDRRRPSRQCPSEARSFPRPLPMEGSLMRRAYLLAAGTGLAVVASLTAYFALPSRSPADPPKPAAPVAHVAAPSETAAQLPIGQVVLFSSGVGYFQREGTIDGDARVDLSFPTQDINDLIKSMVLRDLDGGHVSAVSYDSNAPVEKTLQSFAVNLSANPTFGQVLNQARGEKVEVVLQQANAAQPGTMTGAIMGVEQKQEGVVNVEQLNLWCADGMRSVKLADVQRVRFLNPVMDNEVRKALETLTLSHDTQKKAVSLNFAGEGKRNVCVGYVIENPIWKTSYRLVLGKEKEDKPFLQGWAVVENATDEDWKDVRMALVSGRPISFQMDLYTPLYVPRPTVVPELFASLRPVAYNGNLDPTAPVGITSSTPQSDSLGGNGEDKEGKESASRVTSVFIVGNERTKDHVLIRNAGDLGKKMDLGGSGVSTMATATKLGDFFQYAIDKAVTLPRQKSALLPIVNKDVEGTRCSIYNEQTQAKFPLLGLKFKNTSGLHLMQGPITVFEGSNYAGDARILDLEPNEERLLSYAVDLGTEVNPVLAADNGRFTVVNYSNGLLYTASKDRQTKTYTIVNRNSDDRLVLIEHPVRNDFHLTNTDKPAETASDVYRFEVAVPAGKTKVQTVTEEHDFIVLYHLTDLDDDAIRRFQSAPVASPAMKKGLQQALDLREAVRKTQREIVELQLQLKTITDDQERLRANLKEMPPTAAAYKRYLDKFDAQETQIEKYQADIKTMQDAAHQRQKDFEDFLNTFSAI